MSGGPLPIPGLPITHYRFEYACPSDVYVGIVDGPTSLTSPPRLSNRLHSLAGQLLLLRSCCGTGEVCTQGDVLDSFYDGASVRYFANCSDMMNLNGAVGVASVARAAGGAVVVQEILVRKGSGEWGKRYQAVAGSLLWTLLNDAAREEYLSGRCVEIRTRQPNKVATRALGDWGFQQNNDMLVADAGTVYANLKEGLDRLGFRGVLLGGT